MPFLLLQTVTMQNTVNRVFLAISSFSSISIFYDVDSLTIKFIWKAHYTCTDEVIVLQVSKSISLNSLTGLKRENSNALLDKVMSRNQ